MPEESLVWIGITFSLPGRQALGDGFGEILRDPSRVSVTPVLVETPSPAQEDWRLLGVKTVTWEAWALLRTPHTPGPFSPTNHLSQKWGLSHHLGDSVCSPGNQV